MKNSNLQELKPVYVHEPYTTDEPFTLIDLTLVLVRRWRIIAIIFTLFVTLSIILVSNRQSTYTYTSTIQIGSKWAVDGTLEFLEPPGSLVAKMKHSFIPQVLNDHRSTNPADQKKYQIKIKAPEDSGIIALEIKGLESNSAALVGLLIEITNKTLNDHASILHRIQSNLESQIKSSQLIVKDTPSASSTGVEINSARLASLQPTREVLPPIRSTDPTGTGNTLLFGISILASIFLAIFSALLSEFVAKVKEKSRQ